MADIYSHLPHTHLIHEALAALIALVEHLEPKLAICPLNDVTGLKKVRISSQFDNAL